MKRYAMVMQDFLERLGESFEGGGERGVVGVVGVRRERERERGGGSVCV